MSRQEKSGADPGGWRWGARPALRGRVPRRKRGAHHPKRQNCLKKSIQKLKCLKSVKFHNFIEISAKIPDELSRTTPNFAPRSRYTVKFVLIYVSLSTLNQYVNFSHRNAMQMSDEMFSKLLYTLKGAP